MPANLTILIPTWDRPQEVNQRLREINELWDRDVHVKIQVNPGKFSAKDIDKTLYLGPLEIVENLENIGLFANVVCGLYGINTTWLWILGDDDSLKPEAKHLVEKAILLSENKAADAILFNQWDHNLNQEHIRHCADLETYLQATKFTNSLFISASIWRTSFFRKNLRTFIEYSFSLSSQVLMYLVTLHEHTSSVLVVNQPLINDIYRHRWDRITYLNRVFFLFRHPSVWEQREKIMAFIWPQCKWALTSAAQEQMRTGDASPGEWMRVALGVSGYQVLCAPPVKAAQKIYEIWSVLLDVYPPRKLIQMGLSKVKQTILNPSSQSPPTLRRTSGL